METKSKKSEETKNRIIACAQRLIQKKGFDATSVREIVEVAGCAKGTFYLYFETKMDLLIYISNELFKSFSVMISSELSEMGDDPFAQIDSLFDTLCHRMKETEGRLKFIHTNEILKLVLEQNLSSTFIDSVIGQIAAFLKAGIDRGYFRRVDPILYGKMIFGMGHELLESAMLYNYPDNTETVKKELAIIIRKILENEG